MTLDQTGKRIPDVVENGKTFRWNSIKKAVTISKFLKAFVIADDSGLMVWAIGGKPGVRSARFSGPNAADKDNNKKLLGLMKNVPAVKRKATFVCAIALADSGKLIGTVEGRCNGRLQYEPKGENGFGYDPLFVPNGYKRTFAEMKPGFKNRISHRSKALEKAKKVIERYL